LQLLSEALLNLRTVQRDVLKTEGRSSSKAPVLFVRF